ncbi:S-adenosyl-L-methionine-dependent methyltransferase [Hypoxylon sp. FL0890]|nr:S-adenosyl-L-methionine-dependent methyltransferase [Hypoxylon sp. FL0890]
MAFKPSTAGPSGSSPQSPPQQAAIVAASDIENEEDDDDDDDDDRDDVDSALGDDASSVVHSITSSVLNYRTIQGRTFHSEKHNNMYFIPNDEQQLQSVDITHHYLTMLIGDKLFLAPISDNVQRVLDIGTGTGDQHLLTSTHHSVFAEAYPNAEVIGTDLSPTQPLWVPPNVKFELDDCTQPWTWTANSFDFVHMRYLIGGIADWDELLRQAYRVTRPGGWVQSCEPNVHIRSDDGTVAPDSAYETFWNMLYRDATEKLGFSFNPVEENVQRRAFEVAGFRNIEVRDYKFPVGGWPADKRLAEIGQYVQLTMLNDVEGYTLFLWNTIMGENTPGYAEAMARIRKELRSKKIHGYMTCRYVYGQKPENP